MYFDRFDICEAHYLFLTNYHEGQWSDKYRRLCKLTRKMGFQPNYLLRCKLDLTDNGQEIYAELVKKEFAKMLNCEHHQKGK